MRGSSISLNLWHGLAVVGSVGKSSISVAWAFIVEPFAHPPMMPLGVNCSWFPLYTMGTKWDIAPLSIMPSWGYLSPYLFMTMSDRFFLGLPSTVLPNWTAIVLLDIVVLERDSA